MMQQLDTHLSDESKPKARSLLDRLKRMGITEWHEPLMCLPKSFLDYSKVSTLKHALPHADVVADLCLFALVVTESACIVSQPKKRLILNATDGMLAVKIVVFIHPNVDVDAWKALEKGARFYVRGQLQNWNGTLQMVGPVFVPQQLIGSVLPVYDKRRGVVADGAIYEATRFALVNHLNASVSHLIDSFQGLTEQAILDRAKLKAQSLGVILQAAHAPSSVEEGERGRLAMRRLAALSIVESARRLKKRSPVPASVVQILPALLHELVAKLPYPLTEDQSKAIDEIVADLASPYPMRRVLSGDVGSGKTFCIMIPALAVQRLGHRSVILTPNSLLAEQFTRECKSHFGEATNVISVTSSTKKIDLSGNPILVGTTALMSRLKGQQPPAFFAVDEEQKMSVSQKIELTDLTSNYLQATATPIPRTTALVSHGAMDVSVIRSMPVQKTIKTFVVSATEKQRLFIHTKKIVDAGGQIAVVYPIVDDIEQEKRSVVAAYNDWERHFPGMVGMVHGQMSESEKLTAIEELKQGKKRVMCCSTVVEIGITLPELRSLIVVNAERYGTSTLHQLRGRVARLGGTGYFFMFLPDAVKHEAIQRLQLLVDHSDGFTLSERDAELRGYGDLFEDAERQSGNSRSTVFRCIDLTPHDIHAVSSFENRSG